MPESKYFTNLRLFSQLKVFPTLRVRRTLGEILPSTGPVLAASQELQRLRRRLSRARNQVRKRLRTRLRAGIGGPLHPVRDSEGGSLPVFFVVGRGKSGTSWLMRIFDAHPDILCRGEGRFFGSDWQRDDLKDKQVGVPPRSLYGAIRESEYLRRWVERSVWSREGDTDAQLRGVARAATEYFLRQKLAESGKSIVGDKTPLLTPEFIEEIAEIYPGAKVIHIVRDGRDVTVSAVHHQWNKSEDQGGSLRISPGAAKRREEYRKDPGSTSMFSEDNLRGRARAWRDFVGQAVEDGRTLLGDNYTEVRYEDLLERPEEEIRRLLEFIGAGADGKTVKRCVKATSFERLSKGRKPGEEDATSFFRKGVAGDWKNVFTERDREVFDEVAGDLLIKLGYERGM